MQESQLLQQRQQQQIQPQNNYNIISDINILMNIDLNNKNITQQLKILLLNNVSEQLQQHQNNQITNNSNTQLLVQKLLQNFNFLQNLTLLNLDNCYMENINTQDLNNIKQLKYLFLRRNQFQMLDLSELHQRLDLLDVSMNMDLSIMKLPQQLINRLIFMGTAMSNTDLLHQYINYANQVKLSIIPNCEIQLSDAKYNNQYQFLTDIQQYQSNNQKYFYIKELQERFIRLSNTHLFQLHKQDNNYDLVNLHNNSHFNDLKQLILILQSKQQLYQTQQNQNIKLIKSPQAQKENNVKIKIFENKNNKNQILQFNFKNQILTKQKLQIKNNCYKQMKIANVTYFCTKYGKQEIVRQIYEMFVTKNGFVVDKGFCETYFDKQLIEQINNGHFSELLIEKYEDTNKNNTTNVANNTMYFINLILQYQNFSIIYQLQLQKLYQTYNNEPMIIKNDCLNKMIFLQYHQVTKGLQIKNELNQFDSDQLEQHFNNFSLQNNYYLINKQVEQKSQPVRARLFYKRGALYCRIYDDKNIIIFDQQSINYQFFCNSQQLSSGMVNYYYIDQQQLNNGFYYVKMIFDNKSILSNSILVTNKSIRNTYKFLGEFNQIKYKNKFIINDQLINYNKNDNYQIDLINQQSFKQECIKKLILNDQQEKRCLNETYYQQQIKLQQYLQDHNRKPDDEQKVQEKPKKSNKKEEKKDDKKDDKKDLKKEINWIETNEQISLSYDFAVIKEQIEYQIQFTINYTSNNTSEMIVLLLNEQNNGEFLISENQTEIILKQKKQLENKKIEYCNYIKFKLSRSDVGYIPWILFSIDDFYKIMPLSCVPTQPNQQEYLQSNKINYQSLQKYKEVQKSMKLDFQQQFGVDNLICTELGADNYYQKLTPKLQFDSDSGDYVLRLQKGNVVVFRANLFDFDIIPLSDNVVNYGNKYKSVDCQAIVQKTKVINNILYQFYKELNINGNSQQLFDDIYIDKLLAKLDTSVVNYKQNEQQDIKDTLVKRLNFIQNNLLIKTRQKYFIFNFENQQLRDQFTQILTFFSKQIYNFSYKEGSYLELIQRNAQEITRERILIEELMDYNQVQLEVNSKYNKQLNKELQQYQDLTQSVKEENDINVEHQTAQQKISIDNDVETESSEDQQIIKTEQQMVDVQKKIFEKYEKLQLQLGSEIKCGNSLITCIANNFNYQYGNLQIISPQFLNDQQFSSHKQNNLVLYSSDVNSFSNIALQDFTIKQYQFIYKQKLLNDQNQVLIQKYIDNLHLFNYQLENKSIMQIQLQYINNLYEICNCQLYFVYNMKYLVINGCKIIPLVSYTTVIDNFSITLYVTTSDKENLQNEQQLKKQSYQIIFENAYLMIFIYKKLLDAYE